MRKRALGYEAEETQTLVEETPKGTVKKVVKVKRHVPADPSCLVLLLRLERKQREAAEAAEGGSDGNKEG